MLITELKAKETIEALANGKVFVINCHGCKEVHFPEKEAEELQKELLKKANAKQGFEELADEIDALREEKQALLLEDANRTAMKQRLDELETFLDEQQEPVTDYDEGMVRRLIERIIVFEDHLDFEFKCGLETEVKM